MNTTKFRLCFCLIGFLFVFFSGNSTLLASDFEELKTYFEEARGRAAREDGWTSKHDVERLNRIVLGDYDGPLYQARHGFSFTINHLHTLEYPISTLISASYSELDKEGGDVDMAAHYLLSVYDRERRKGNISDDAFYVRLDEALMTLADEWERGLNREKNIYTAHIIYRAAAGIANNQKAWLKIEEFHRKDIGVPWWVSNVIKNDEVRREALDKASCNSEASRLAFVKFSSELCKEAEIRKELYVLANYAKTSGKRLRVQMGIDITIPRTIRYANSDCEIGESNVCLEIADFFEREGDTLGAYIYKIQACAHGAQDICNQSVNQFVLRKFDIYRKQAGFYERLDEIDDEIDILDKKYKEREETLSDINKEITDVNKEIKKLKGLK